MDVKLSLKLSKAVHDRCHNVPHDIGIELEQIVREHQNEQLNKLSVVRGGDKENQTVKRKKKFYNYPSYKGTRLAVARGWEPNSAAPKRWRCEDQLPCPKHHWGGAALPPMYLVYA